MSADPAFASTILLGSALLTAGAETDLQTPTKTATIVTGGSSGSKIEKVVVEMTSTGAGGLVATSVAGLVYLFLRFATGPAWTFFDSIVVEARTASTTAAPFRTERYYPDLFLADANWSLRASQSVAGNQSATLALSVQAFGGSL